MTIGTAGQTTQRLTLTTSSDHGQWITPSTPDVAPAPILTWHAVVPVEMLALFAFTV
jgi:hypothetical protein